MLLFDANILIYAVNESAPQHAAVSDWIVTVQDSGEGIALTWDVLSAFVRILTNPRNGMQVLAREEVHSFVSGWLEHPDIRLIRPTPGHWDIFRSLLDESQAVGNLVTDAHLAAIAIGNGARLASCDADFARFSKLRWVNPLAAA